MQSYVIGRLIANWKSYAACWIVPFALTLSELHGHSRLLKCSFLYCCAAVDNIFTDIFVTAEFLSLWQKVEPRLGIQYLNLFDCECFTCIWDRWEVFVCKCTNPMMSVMVDVMIHGMRWCCEWTKNIKISRHLHLWGLSVDTWLNVLFVPAIKLNDHLLCLLVTEQCWM